MHRYVLFTDGLSIAYTLFFGKQKLRMKKDCILLEIMYNGSVTCKGTSIFYSGRKILWIFLILKEVIIMKVQNITDIDAFFKVIDQCRGKVELVTGEGDRLNLKSKLSQYVSMANIFSNGEIPELEILAYEKEDTDRLIGFMMNSDK